MAKVPQQLAPTVQLQAVRGPNAGNVNLGPSPFEKPLDQLSRTFDNIHKREVKASSQDALLQYERKVQDLLYAENTGYTHLRGRDAMKSGRDVMSQLEDLRLQYAEGIEDPDARSLFDSSSQAHMLRARQTVMNHADRESKFYQSQVLEAEQQTTLTNGALFYNDPSNFALEFGRGEKAVLENLQLQGLDSDPDVRAAALQKYRSGFYTNGVTAALGNQDLKEAERLLAQGDPVMDAGTKATLKNRVRILRDSLTQKNDFAIAQSVVDQVWNPDGATREQMAAAIRKRLSGKREKSAIADLNQRWAEHKDAQQTDEESATRDAMVLIQQGTRYEDLPVDVTSKIPSGDALKSLERYDHSLYETGSAATNDSRVANAQAIADFNEVAARSLTEAANLDLTTFGKDHGVDSTGMSKLIELKSKAKRGEVEKPVKLLTTATNHPLIKQAMQTLYSDIDPKTDYEKLQRVQLAATQVLSMLLQDPQYSDKEYLGPDEYNQLAKDLIRKARTSDDIEMAKIPPAMLLDIQTKLKEAGHPSTPGFIVQAYKDRLRAEETTPVERRQTGQMGRTR